MMKRLAFALALSVSAFSIGCATTQTAGLGTWISWPEPSKLSAGAQSAISAMESGDLEAAAKQLTPALRQTDAAAAFLHAEILALQGRIESSLSSYADFVATHPDHSLTAAALVRMLLLSEPRPELLNFESISKIRVSDPYANAQLVVLQSRAMRGAADAPGRTHPSAVPLVRWRWMGPFTPFVQSGFASEQPFDSDPLLAAQYEVDGKIIEPYQYRPENITAMAASTDGVYAAETHVKTTVANAFQLTVQGSQLYTVYVDGVPVLTRDVTNFGQESVLASTFRLEPGDHTLRIRLGLTPASNTTRHIALWLSPAPSGDNASVQALADIVESDQPASGLPADSVKDIQRIDTDRVLKSSQSIGADDPFRTWTASMLAIAAGKVQTADALLANRLASRPDDMTAAYLQALRYRKDADIDESIRNEKSMSLLRNVSDNAPQIVMAHQILMTEFLKQGQPKQALGIWEKHFKSRPSNDAYASLLFSQIAGALSWSEISAEFALLAAAQAPGSCALNAAAIELQNQDHLYTSYDSLPQNLQACPQIILHYAGLENDAPSPSGNDVPSDRWLLAVQKLTADYPAEGSLRIDAIKAGAMANPKAAATELLELLTPAASTYLVGSSLGSADVLEIIDRLRAAGLNSEAGAILDKALELMPSDASLQYMRVKNQNARLFHDLRIDGMQTIREYLAQNREDPGNSVMILDYAATKIAPDGSKIGLTHQISRVLTKEGKNSVGEVYLPANAALLKVRTIKDGTLEIIDPEAIGYKESITAPNLAVGDYVETEYLTFEPPASRVSARAATDTFFFGAQMVPLVRSEYVVDYPKDWNVEVIQAGPKDQIQLTCAPNGEFTRCIAKRENIPPYIPENNSDTIFDLIPNIQFTWLYDWDFIRNALSETITRQTRRTPYLERFYEKIGVPESGSVWEHARAVYDFVIDAIDESESSTIENETATSTVTRGVGSRLLTLKSLYDIAGFSSYIALRRAFGAPAASDLMPALYNSTHEFVLVVDTEKGPAYVQPDDDFMPFDYLDPASQNQPVIPADPGRPVFTSRTDDPDLHRSNIDIAYDIREDGTACASSVETIRGSRAVMMRNFFNMVKNDHDMAEQLIQNSLAQSYGRIELKELSNERLEDRNAPFTLKYAFDISQFADPADDRLNILSRIFAYNLVSQLAAKSPSEQKNAVYVGDSKISRRTLTFHAPAGYRWQTETMHEVNIASPFGKYTRQAAVVDHALVVTESIQLLAQRVDTDRYADFRDFCLKVDEAQRAVISASK